LTIYIFNYYIWHESRNRTYRFSFRWRKIWCWISWRRTGQLSKSFCEYVPNARTDISRIMSTPTRCVTLA
jgi:hypothetical protein